MPWVFACQNKGKRVLNKKKMEQVMYDVYVAEAMIENDYRHFDTPEKKEAYIHQVFKKHRITQADWDTSLAWYSEKISICLKINDSVKSRIQKQIDLAEQKLIAQHAIEEDARQRVLSESYVPHTYSFASSVVDRLRFRLDSLQIVERIPNDTFSFAFDVVGIPKGKNNMLRSGLILEYGDTTMYENIAVEENKNYRFQASKYIKNDTLRNLLGFVHCNHQPNNVNIQLYNIILGKDSVALKNDTIQEKHPDTQTPRQMMIEDDRR